jgi:hypothetical protein
MVSSHLVRLARNSGSARGQSADRLAKSLIDGSFFGKTL